MISIDVYTKFLAVKYLKNNDSLNVINDFFKLSYVENTGAAFGNFFNQNNKLILLSLFCVFFIIIAIKYSKNRYEIFGFFLILTGAFGNLIDRYFRGYVVDFFDFDFFNITIPPFYFFNGFYLDRWPVFNFADSYIFIGAWIVLISCFFQKNN